MKSSEIFAFENEIIIIEVNCEEYGMKQVTFYYVRHGQTLFNRLGRMQGRCDSPLTEKGIQDACKAKEALKDVDFANAYTSTSERCIDTSNIILEGKNVPLHYEKDLKEYNFGILEGMKIFDHLDLIDPIRFHTFDWTEYEGENYEMVLKRIKGIWDRIYEENEDGANVLLVSHGSVFMHMIDGIFHLNKEKYLSMAVNNNGVRMPVPNGYVGIFTCKDGVYELQYLTQRPDDFLRKLKEE